MKSLSKSTTPMSLPPMHHTASPGGHSVTADHHVCGSIDRRTARTDSRDRWSSLHACTSGPRSEADGLPFRQRTADVSGHLVDRALALVAAGPLLPERIVCGRDVGVVGCRDGFVACCSHAASGPRRREMKIAILDDWFDTLRTLTCFEK